ncbi:uncharacterized protein LOC129876881 isoform X2 [Solanum dulcamara]|uniref:uncharacterized protein LOC129876881 isoform X2 n=1 Tax=Solanum dulcamara TaxID=45834 RepID=UPI002484F83F|nr:uncharacterized protein LOC129876881 isoform X2 [Solanum dulcamara]
MATGYYGMIEELHVVLVDHEQENTTEMVDLLKSYDYEGCFPKDIVEIMNVPGLTRMQLVIYRDQCSSSFSSTWLVGIPLKTTFGEFPCSGNNTPLSF